MNPRNPPAYGPEDSTCIVCSYRKFYIYVHTFHFHLEQQLDVNFFSQIQSSTTMFMKGFNVQTTIECTMHCMPGAFLGSISCQKCTEVYIVLWNTCMKFSRNQIVSQRARSISKNFFTMLSYMLRIVCLCCHLYHLVSVRNRVWLESFWPLTMWAWQLLWDGLQPLMHYASLYWFCLSTHLPCFATVA